MFRKLFKHFNSFDSFRGFITTLLLFFPVFWGLKTDNFTEAFTFVLGIMAGYFANIEGTNRNRIIGMTISVLWAFLVLFCCLSSYYANSLLHIFVIISIIFTTSMLSVFGYRGSMVSFSGLFAVVLSFAIEKTNLPLQFVLLNVLMAGGMYIIIAGIGHWFFQTKHIKILLADSCELIAEYLLINEKIRWTSTKNTADTQSDLLKINGQLNEKLELLRSILLSQSDKMQHNIQLKNQFSLFSELVNIYEISVAKDTDYYKFEEVLADYIHLTEPFKNIANDIIASLQKLANALRFGNEYEVSHSILDNFKLAETNISLYVAALKPVKAREGALLMRNLYDHETAQYQKILLVQKILTNHHSHENNTLQKAKLFVPKNEYSIKKLKDNLNTKSIIFRHALRITLAVMIGFIIGKYINHAQSNWIIMTIILILRPNFGLSKSRAYSRFYGTFIGGIITLSIVFITKNTVFYGIISCMAMFMGFTYIQKNYKTATLFITISILLLYFVNSNAPLETTLYRVTFTAIGFLIAILAIYLFWPVWEQNNISEFIKKSVDANINYLRAISDIYHSKTNIETDYKLIRKDAFLYNGNLNAAFQRMAAEPKSKQKNLSNIYALIILNQSFLSTSAAYSSYIQGHSTTKPSVEFDEIIKKITLNLETASNILSNQNYGSLNTSDTAELELNILKQKYLSLNELRNQELALGKTIMSAETRNNLQEAKITIEQLKRLLKTSENIKNTALILDF